MGRGDGWVEIHVINDGPLIEGRHREQIFEPFFTTHSRGTGLGLYIARELCEANGASIDLRDNVKGVDFCVSGRAGRVTAARTERRGQGAQPKVLVVDDEADIRELLDLTLARMGIPADCAASVGGARCMPRARGVQPVPD